MNDFVLCSRCGASAPSYRTTCPSCGHATLQKIEPGTPAAAPVPVVDNPDNAAEEVVRVYRVLEGMMYTGKVIALVPGDRGWNAIIRESSKHEVARLKSALTETEEEKRQLAEAGSGLLDKKKTLEKELAQAKELVVMLEEREASITRELEQQRRLRFKLEVDLQVIEKAYGSKAIGEVLKRDKP